MTEYWAKLIASIIMVYFIGFYFGWKAKSDNVKETNAIKEE